MTQIISCSCLVCPWRGVNFSLGSCGRSWKFPRGDFGSSDITTAGLQKKPHFESRLGRFQDRFSFLASRGWVKNGVFLCKMVVFSKTPDQLATKVGVNENESGYHRGTANAREEDLSIALDETHNFSQTLDNSRLSCLEGAKNTHFMANSASNKVPPWFDE